MAAQDRHDTGHDTQHDSQHDTQHDTRDTEREEALMRPDGQRYQAPESAETREGKGWALGLLALLVVVLMALVATGAVPLFPR
jgi:hypothetical protein